MALALYRGLPALGARTLPACEELTELVGIGAEMLRLWVPEDLASGPKRADFLLGAPKPGLGASGRSDGPGTTSIPC